MLLANEQPHIPAFASTLPTMRCYCWLTLLVVVQYGYVSFPKEIRWGRESVLPTAKLLDINFLAQARKSWLAVPYAGNSLL